MVGKRRREVGQERARHKYHVKLKKRKNRIQMIQQKDKERKTKRNKSTSRGHKSQKNEDITARTRTIDDIKDSQSKGKYLRLGKVLHAVLEKVTKIMNRLPPEG
jgi:hypothetical protein